MNSLETEGYGVVSKRPGFPTAKEAAGAVLLYKVGYALRNKKAQLEELVAGAWPVEVLSNSDVDFMSSLGVDWHERPKHNGYLPLLDGVADSLSAEGLEFDMEIDVIQRGWKRLVIQRVPDLP